MAAVYWTTMNVIPDLKDFTTSDTATDVSETGEDYDRTADTSLSLL